ncbi:MAG: radical SAM protein, partial [uncultured bacterium]
LSYLAEQGHSIVGSRIPWKERQGLKNFLEQIKKSNIKTVGISAFTFEIPWAEKVAEAIRKDFPQIKIILGGPHADTCYVSQKKFEKAYKIKYPLVHTDDNELRRLFKYFDYVAIGSGEIAIDNLLKGKSGYFPVLRGGVPEDYQNPKIANALNRFIVPVRLLKTEAGFYPLPENYSGTETYTGTEGCPNNCWFCTSALTCQRHYVDRKNSIPQLVNTIKQSPKNLIWFDNEISQLPWLINFSKELEKQKVKGKSWMLMCGIDTFATKNKIKAETENIFKLMAENGCLQICYGVESINPEILTNYNKTSLNQGIRDKVLQLTNEAGIIPRAMMVFGGKNETENTLKAFIKWTKSCPALTFRIAYVTPFRGTPNWYEVNRENRWINDELRDNLEHHTTDEPVVKCPVITKDGSLTGEVDAEKLEKFRDFKIEALKEIYNSAEYHAKIRNFIEKHPAKTVVIRGLIYLFEKQGLVEEGSFDHDFEQALSF